MTRLVVGSRISEFPSESARRADQAFPKGSDPERNSDDHLRNHGFLCGEVGRRLAPAFDMNPSIDRREHVLTIDGLVAAPAIELAVASAGFYGIDDGRANEIVEKTKAIVSTWKERARKLGIAAGDIDLTGSAFFALDDGGERLL